MKKKIEKTTTESFFDFLDEHIEKGFNEIKRKYSLDYYTYEEYGFIPVESIDGYYLIYPTSDSDQVEYNRNEKSGEAYMEYLNPKIQRKVKIVKRYGIELKRSDNSLYKELALKYSREYNLFYKNLTKEITYERFSSEEQIKIIIESILIRINNYKYQVESEEFSIKYNDKDCLLLHIMLTKLTEKIQKAYLSKLPFFSPKAETNNKDLKPKKPSAAVIMEFIEIIGEVYPKEWHTLPNTQKFSLIAKKIEEKYGYKYSGGTLENNRKGIDGFSEDVYNLLKDWGRYNEALRYKNDPRKK